MSSCPMSSFPIPRECPFDPPKAYKEFQQTPGGVQVKLWDGSNAWVFTRYEDVRVVLGDNRFSGDPFSQVFRACRRHAAQCWNWSPRSFAWIRRSTAAFDAC